MLKYLDSGFRRNDEFYGIAALYEIINIILKDRRREKNDSGHGKNRNFCFRSFSSPGDGVGKNLGLDGR
jgi:hypothetical protein